MADPLRRWREALRPDQARLTVHTPGKPPRDQPLQGSCYRLGRDDRADVVIDHGAVSRRHALLEQRGSAWVLTDRDSTNGLWWQGRRIRELVLRDGDAVRFGPSHQGGLPEISFDQPPRRWLRRLLPLLGLGAAGLTAAGLLLLALSLLRMPIRGSLASIRAPLVIHDGADRPISSVDDVRHRELQRLDDYPPVLIEALLASEDSRFWWHPGVDPIGTGRALVVNLLGGRVLEGGSTLTQQLARSLYPKEVGQGETFARKWRELLVALQLEARFSKRDLLLSYLNRVYLGAVWGFEDAARRFFDKPASRLSLEEAALLVGLLPSPNGYDPCVDPQAALTSRNRVLAKMAAGGRISADRARAARRQPVTLAGTACRASRSRAAPYYSDQVRRDLEMLVGPEVAAEGNFLVRTHLDPGLQEVVERRLRQKIDASRGLGVTQGAVVVLDSRNGGILAIAGGRDYSGSQFNRASMALRQPGSTFKLMPYIVALDQGSGPDDRVGCGPLTWRGQTFTSGCSGSLSLRRAMAVSSNTAALRLARKVGLEAVVQKARDLGISSPLDPVPGLVLGQSEVTLLELTGAYGAVANGGVWNPPSTIRRITDIERCPLPAGEGEKGTAADNADNDDGAAPALAGCAAEQGEQQTVSSRSRRVMKDSTARAMRGLLQGVVRSGTGSAAFVGGEAGGKTGTTNRGRDLLFVGFHPARHWVMGVWLGNDDNRPTRSSSALAASLWGEIVRSAPSD